MMNIGYATLGFVKICACDFILDVHYVKLYDLLFHVYIKCYKTYYVKPKIPIKCKKKVMRLGEESI